MDALYTKALLRLAADAHGFGRLPKPEASGDAHSAMCGDRIHVDLALANDHIVELGHDTKACVLTQASASLLAQAAIGRSQADMVEARKVIAEYLNGGPRPEGAFEGFQVFDALRDHATRHACVLLPFRAVDKAFAAKK
jgi:NifU-like protein involved in Fe-S cluster formation